MNTFVTIFGWVCLAAICIAVAAAAVVAAAEGCRRALERFEWAVDVKTRHEVGRSIGASAWWFSECPDTSLALRILAEHLINQGTADANNWREQWRKARQSPDKASGASEQ